MLEGLGFCNLLTKVFGAFPTGYFVNLLIVLFVSTV